MKSKSTLFLLSGIAIGVVAGVLFAPQKKLKITREVSRKAKQYKKAFEQSASRYKDKLAARKTDKQGQSAV